ncbi:Hypothetical predicted protein [Pelobates cultripes]|uniref:Uncharacterized protein n=1 Tax=Pelobates cultripes TaxID=61616 RepID=A0AAD1WIU2_PELCU|nr:Hypothetical predicted protein [Pelobates cultripes]
MAAQRGPQERSTYDQPSTHPLGEFDQLCESLWTMLRERGMAYRRAAKLVATWIRPVTRRCHYRHPPQASVKAARLRKHRHSHGRETTPCYMGDCTCPHIQETKTIQPAFHASYSPDPMTSVRQSLTQSLQATTANRGDAQLNSPLNAAGAESQSRGAFEESNVDGKRHVHATGIG